MKIIVNGNSLNYSLDGPKSAPTVMLSHSLSANMAMWEAQMAALGRLYRVLRYDTRGHGASGVTPGSYSLTQLALDAVGLLDALTIERVHFVGLSMGGMIGQVLGLEHGRRLSSLCICDSTSRVPADMVGVWDDRIRLAENEGMDALVESTVERWFTAPFRKRHKAEVDKVRRMIVETPVGGYVGCVQAIKRLDLTDRLGAVKTPTLVIVGKDDPSTPPAASEEINRRIGGSKLVVLDDAAHLSNVEQAKAFNDALLGFLGRVPAS